MLNEFRQDPVSGDWVLFATQRAKKPGEIEKDSFYQSKEDCPFDGQRLVDQGSPIEVYAQGQLVSGLPETWSMLVIENKYPALAFGMCSPIRSEGPFLLADGRGFHELVITRDHEKSFAQFTTEETAEVIRAYLSRFKFMSQDGCGEYVSIFHNHGHLAGASVYHNHSQILSMPIVPGGVLKNINNARSYFEKTGKHIHEVLLAWEIKENKRVVYENETFIVLCPYVSRGPYEMRIFKKVRQACFGDLSDGDIPLLADALNMALGKLNKALDNVDYVFYIHTAPLPKAGMPSYDLYHWHIEILPRRSPAAGLELGTNVFMNDTDPDEAAALLRATTI